MSPAEARLAKAAFRTLDSTDVGTLDALGEVLLPGSAASGLSHYIDHQLSGSLPESMLVIKYLGVNPPFADFYKAGLAAARAAARTQYDASVSALSAANARALVGQMAAGAVTGWGGPPAALFYFVLRSDAIDVVYGTQIGFESLGVPYMPHIVPPSRWGE